MNLSTLFRYGTFVALVLLCILFSVLTYGRQFPDGASGATALARQITNQFEPDARILIAVPNNDTSIQFAESLTQNLTTAGFDVVANVKGEAADARKELLRLREAGEQLDAVAGNHTSANWLLFKDIRSDFPELGEVIVIEPASYNWPGFLTAANLRNITIQVSVLGILAVGMTFVIIAGGIDLSVGSLIALAAVVSTYLIREYLGAREAGVSQMFLAGAVGILACGIVGAFSGSMIIYCGVPPFIVTLSIMLTARGIAKIIANNDTIFELPDQFTWLGRGADLGGIPNTVVLMLLLYVVGHILMSKTLIGRYIYAVGDNKQAAWLSGVPVKSVLMFTYVCSGMLAGLGGVIMASDYQSGSSKYGETFELYVIAAVVIGGTSLSGGRGSIIGTLVGALIIQVIRNGMNLTGVDSNVQDVILGSVILIAVLLDKFKERRNV